MSHETFKKSTREEIEQMMILRREGKSTQEIENILHKDHTSIIYWLKKIGPNNIFVDNFDPKYVIIDIVKQKIPETYFLNHCARCKKLKDRRWKKSDWCGIKCWHEENKKIENYLYW